MVLFHPAQFIIAFLGKTNRCMGWDGIGGGGMGWDGSQLFPLFKPLSATKLSTELARNRSHLTMQSTSSLRFHTSQLGGPSLPSRDVAARWEDLSGDCFVTSLTEGASRTVVTVRFKKTFPALRRKPSCILTQ